jgi:MoxR-like ATPase
MPYEKIFDPEKYVKTIETPAETALLRAGDRRDGEVYVYDAAAEVAGAVDEIVLAVNVAISTKRPLLIYGPPGSGKSSLAPHVARCLGWRFHHTVITSRTQARDLLYRFDSVRRLNDAQIEGSLNENMEAYIEPGILWWAFNPQSAKRRGLRQDKKLTFNEAVEPDIQLDHNQAVVLIDEIDKADPDVPNNLLVPLGSYTFKIHETEEEVKIRNTPLVVLTTNDERELPKAFIRRCVVLTLKAPKPDRLIAIAQSHFGTDETKLYTDIVPWIEKAAVENKTQKLPQPSTAEYLDAISACLRLKVQVGEDSEEWKKIYSFVLRKRSDMDEKK